MPPPRAMGARAIRLGPRPLGRRLASRRHPLPTCCRSLNEQPVPQRIARVRLVGVEPEDLTAEDFARLHDLIQKQLGATDGPLRQSLVNVAAHRGSVIITATVYRVVGGEQSISEEEVTLSAEEIRGALRPDLQDKITGVIDLLGDSHAESLPCLASRWEAPVLPGGLEPTELEIMLQVAAGGERALVT